MRNKTIDTFRGIIMILMAIDHISYFILDIHFYEGFDLLASSHTTLSFLTRFITHLCAPGFFFALGYGAYFKYHKKSRFNLDLLFRGVFLILLQLTVINWIWNIEVRYMGVIFALGSVLILLNLLMPILKKYGLYIGVLLLILSQYIISYTSLIEQEALWIRLLFVPGFYKETYILYVIIPWFGLAAIGVFFATLKKIPYLKIAALSLSLFFILRTAQSFGNSHIEYNSLIDYFNVTKYPPSLVFLLLTMGINFTMMFFIEHYKVLQHKILLTFGQAALVFYVCHLGLYRFISLYYQTKSYYILYGIWILSLFLLYVPCRYLNKYELKKILKQ